MRNLFPFLLLLIGFISLQRHELSAQTSIPRTLSIQGVLTSSFGSTPLKGKQVFRVGIYESPLGGLPLHEQIDTVLVGETGLYQFSLGGMTGLPRTVKFDKPYFIDISVNGEKQNMRIPLQSAAYAFMAGAVENEAIGLEQLSPVIREKIFPEDKKGGEKALANYPNGFRTIIAGGDENRTNANYSSILGGFTNSVSGAYGSIVGGQANQVQGNWAFVGGGRDNRAQGSWSTVTGGYENTVTSAASSGTIAGGQQNQIGGSQGTIGGGQANLVTSQAGTVSGGQNNRSLQTHATIAGGNNNQASGPNTFVGGGNSNRAITQNAVVVGGVSNTASGLNSFIGAGNRNVSSGAMSSIMAGQDNIASGTGSTVGGGNNNKSSNIYTTVSGGINNDATAQYSTVAGGNNNDAFGDFSTIGGGINNLVGSTAKQSIIAGGLSNRINSMNSTISGGTANDISVNSRLSFVGGGDTNVITHTSSSSSINSVISGGNKNTVLNSSYAAIDGGRQNTITTSSHYSSIGGGQSSTITNSDYASISGGTLNTIHSSRFAFIGSGNTNTIGTNSTASVIGGGEINDIGTGATQSVIAGGYDNDIANNGIRSTIVGGYSNGITGNYSTIAGGNDNTINGLTNVVGGGEINSITGSHGTVGGGRNNRITNSAQFSTIAGGVNNTVSADYGTASGNSNTISTAGTYGVSLGNANQVSATYGVAIGNTNQVTGSHGVAIGYNNTAAANAMAIGIGSTAAANQLYAKYSAGHVFEGQGTAIGNYVAQFYNPTPGGSGIEIKIANPIPSKSNNFVTFENASGGRVGRITGQTLAEMYASNSYKAEKRRLEREREQKILKAVTGGLSLANKTAKAVQLGVEVISGPPQIASATASTVATLGAGAGWTSNTVVKTVFKIVEAGIAITDATIAGYQEGEAIAEAALSKEKIEHWIQKQDAQIGVTYESGSADYAEWLPKQEATIDFAESSVVGIHKGKIRYETEGAEQLMVVSSRPMILGNMPANGKEYEFEAVAFMGQVPVSVLGAVTKGDFILPSGGNHGLGIAVHPEDMRNEDFGNIVGIAWSDAPDTFAINKVNVAVGLQTTTLANQISKQSKEIAELKKAVRMINESLIAMSNNQSKTASISVNQDKTFYLVNDQSIIDSKPSLNGETKIPVHAMHKESLLKFDTMISSNDIPTLQINTSILSAFGNDPILKELYFYSVIQRLIN